MEGNQEAEKRQTDYDKLYAMSNELAGEIRMYTKEMFDIFETLQKAYELGRKSRDEEKE